MSDPQTHRPAGDESPVVDFHREPIDLLAGHEPAADPGRPAGPSRRRLLVLGAAALVGLAGATWFGSFAWRIAAEKDAILETGSQVAGLARDDSDRARETAEYLRDALAAEIDLDRSVGAIYQDPGAADRSVLLFGGTTLIWQPERDLDELFKLLSDDTGTVSGLRKVSPGQLGGVMKCGVTATGDGELTVCGWADHGSVMMAMFPGRAIDESAGLMRQIRDDIQSRD